MVKSMFAGVAGLRTHQSRMDVISNNIANVNTWGYKSRTANFQDAMYQNLRNSTGGNAANGIGGVNSSQLGYGVNMGSISTNFSTGSRGYTGRSLDCLIDGTGFFIVGGRKDAPVDPNELKENGLSLSRVGIFSPDSEGYLVDDSGNYIYGFAVKGDVTAANPEYEDTLTPIRVPVKAGTDRYDVQTYKIGTDGTIVGVDADEVSLTIGKLAVASVENPNGLEQTSGYLYSIGANAGRVAGMATSPATGQIISNFLEMSNVDLATDISTMITTQRGYQANSKIITVTDQMLEELVNMKR